MNIVSIKHDTTEFATLTSNSSITLNCNNKIINDDISAEFLTLPTYSGELLTMGVPVLAADLKDIIYLVMEPCYTGNYEFYIDNAKIGYLDSNLEWHEEA